MLSELIISFTLLINAGAVLNFNLKRKNETDDFVDENAEPSFGKKLRDFLEALKHFRAIIGMWNFFVMFLMIVFFGS